MVLKLKKKWGLIAILLLWLAVISVILGMTLTEQVGAKERLIPIYSVDTGEKKQVSLTFNAAWGDETTDEILNLLDEYGIKASFFFVGDFAEKYPESVRKIHNRGHDVGNHSMKHVLPTRQSYKEICEDITRCNEVLQGITGQEPTLYRAPSGDYDNNTIGATQSLGMTAVQWDCDSIDWKNKSPDEIHRRIMKKLSPGSIVLFHLGKENTLKALPGLIEEMQKQGYEIVPLSEMLLKGDTYTDIQGRQRRSEASQ